MGTLFFGHCGTCKRCRQEFTGSSSRKYCMRCYPAILAWVKRQKRGSSYPRRHGGLDLSPEGRHARMLEDQADYLSSFEPQD